LTIYSITHKKINHLIKVWSGHIWECIIGTICALILKPKDMMFDWFETVDFTRYPINSNIDWLHQLLTVPFVYREGCGTSRASPSNKGHCAYVMPFHDIYDPFCSDLPHPPSRPRDRLFPSCPWLHLLALHRTLSLANMTICFFKTFALKCTLACPRE